MIDYREALDLQDGIPGVFQDELHECPETGSGERRVFRWIFYIVNRLLPYCSPDEIFAQLQDATADCGRNTDTDILGAISAAKRPKYRGGSNAGFSNFTRKETGKTQKEAVQKDYPRVIALYRKHGDYNRLLRYCGTTPELLATRTLDWLYDLYRPEDILGPGAATQDTIVAPLEHWGQLLKENYLELRSKLCFLTPNPYRPDATGRCDAGILERRYFVLEGDIIDTKTKKNGSVVPTP